MVLLVRGTAPEFDGRVERWVRDGIISAEQGRKIVEAEARSPAPARHGGPARHPRGA